MKTKEQVISKLTKLSLKGIKVPDFGHYFKFEKRDDEQDLNYSDFIAKRISEKFNCSFEVGKEVANELFWNN